MNKFLEEILDQPQVIKNMPRYYKTGPGEELLMKLKRLYDAGIKKPVIFTGMGSSYFVSHAASLLFNELNIDSFPANASELLHYSHSLLKGNRLLFCISQSGESYEIKEILAMLPGEVHCAAIVNDEGSTLAEKASVALPCRAGREEMTSTKTYVATSLVSFIAGWHLSGMFDNGRVRMIERMADNTETILNNRQQLETEMLSFLGDLNNLQIIARGPSFSTACQSALMFREALKLPAAATLGGEFRHGPMEMVSDGFKAVLFASGGKTYSQSIRMAEDIAAFGGKVLLITNKKTEESGSIKQIFVDEPDEYLFSVQSIIPVQLFVDSYARSKGFEAGDFSRGAKVTAIE